MAPSSTTLPPVSEAVRAHRAPAGRQPASRPPSDTPKATARFAAADGEPAVAVVNGMPISRPSVVDLLVRSHGAAVLEQIVGLELARMAAEAGGVRLTERDVDDEYDLALRRLTDPLTAVTPDSFDRTASETVLEKVLAERNVSRHEFLLVIRRNAYLRKLAEKRLAISEEDLQAECDRVYGRRVQVRHIQLGSSGDVARVRDRLASGEDFADLARRYSANSASAEAGGLLDPFARGDEDVPDGFRRVAFSLAPGAVSAPVRIGAWEHFIKVERVLESQDVAFASVRDELVARLRGRLAEQQMPRVHEELMREATIEIADPVLRSEFRKRYPQRPEAGRR